MINAQPCKLADYKKLLKGHEKDISRIAGEAFAKDWRIGAIGAFNRATACIDIPRCTNENTANAVLHWCDRKVGK